AALIRGRRPLRILAPSSPDTRLSNPASSDGRTRMYAVRANDILLSRFRVRGSIGFGNSGTVVRAEDQITGTAVAVKILHRDEDLHGDVELEERVYKKLVAGCNPSISLFARVLGSGSHRGFHCIVFELCHGTLYDVMQGYSALLPLPARHLVEIGYQLVKAVEYLHSMKLVHTDIKLDNIALRCHDTVRVRWLDPLTGFHEKKMLVSAQICLIDLGGVIELQGRGLSYGRIGTRGYRAPEVALAGIPWTSGVDSFAIGCVLAELYLSHNLFDPTIEDDREYLVATERLLGPFPREYAVAIESKYAGTFKIEDSVYVQFPPAHSVMLASDYAESLRRLEAIKPLAAQVHDGDLCNLVGHLMALNPAERISMEEAARHKFFD
ncbi:kinase-like protein, partial [Cubamyces sp. BRFM 1775]